MIDYVKFASLPVYDQDRALEFYRDKMGFVVAQDRPYQGEKRWIELSIPEARTRIWFADRPDEVPSIQPTLIFITSDLDGVYERLSGMGVHFMQPPSVAPWSPGERYALAGDSEGNIIMLGEAHG